MSHAFKAFLARIAAANPNPGNETPAYLAFNRFFQAPSLFTMILVSYAMILAFAQDAASLVAVLQGWFPMLSARVAFLGGPGSFSAYAYLMTTAAMVALVGVKVLVHLSAYVGLVLRARDAAFVEVSSLGIVFVLRGWGLAALFVWLVYFDVPHGASYAHVGMATILSWPFFPAVGAVVAWMVSGWVFHPLALGLRLFRRARPQSAG